MLEKESIEKSHRHSASRFSKSMVAASTMTCFLHLVLSIVYIIMGVTPMVIYNICGLFLFLWLRRLFKTKWIKIPFILGSIDVILGICLADYFIGWESNFNIYMLLLPASMLIYTGWKIWETALYMFLFISTYLVLFILLSDHDGTYEINSEVIKYLSIGNTIAAISILLVILRHMNSSIKEMQRSLENKNKLLEKKKSELDKKVIERTTTLENANNDLRQFTYIATHDLKVPIDNISGCYNILLHDSENASDKTKLIMPWIKKSLDQASLIISQLIQLEKAGTDYNVYESINLEEATQHIINCFSAKVIALNADIVTDFRDCETLHYSKGAFNSIAQNLISNALKYHSPDRRCRITIKAKRTNDFLCFSVEDNGLGIDLEVQRNRLFGLFQRISTKEEGSGLGLHMIKKILENSGGKIDVESEVGKGSVFHAFIKEIA